MLVSNPDECIDCGVCEPECPPNAILPDTRRAWRSGWSSSQPVERLAKHHPQGRGPADAII